MADKNENKKYKSGLSVMRLQPLHVGHCLIIRQMLAECNTGVILIGSADAMQDERNPFTVKERSQMITNVFPVECETGTLRFRGINNLGNRRLWAGYVLAEIWRDFKLEPEIYYCGSDQDGELFLGVGMEVAEVVRDIIPISATKVREQLLAGDKKALQYIHPVNREMVANFFNQRCF